MSYLLYGNNSFDTLEVQSNIIKNTPITREMIEGAKLAEIKYGVPTSITLAQILQESRKGGGLSGLASAPNYNLFGIKAFSSWKGETVRLKNGSGDSESYSTYRKYGSYAESIEDHAKVLQADRYTKYTKNADNYKEYAEGIAKGGYAGDSNYSANLIKQIEKYNLDKLDGDNVYIAPSYVPDIEYESGTDAIKNKINSIAGNIIYYLAIGIIVVFAFIAFISAFELGGK